MSTALAWFILPRLFQFFLGKDSVHKSCPSGLAIQGPMVFLPMKMFMTLCSQVPVL